MAEENVALFEPFGPRCADVVLTLHLEDSGARLSDHDGQRNEGEHQDREDALLGEQPVPSPRHVDHLEPDDEEEDQQRAGDVDGKGVGEVDPADDGVVEAGIVPGRGDDPERDADQRGEKGGRDAELKRDREGRGDHLVHRSLLADGVPEIPVQQVVQIRGELVQKRLVKAVFLAQGVHRDLVDSNVVRIEEHALDRVPRAVVHHRVGDEQDEEETSAPAQQSHQQVTQHQCSPDRRQSTMTIVVGCRRPREIIPVAARLPLSHMGGRFRLSHRRACQPCRGRGGSSPPHRG